jgi:hypothetical protein
VAPGFRKERNKYTIVEKPSLNLEVLFREEIIRRIYEL